MGKLLLLLLPQAVSLLGSSIAQFGIIWTLTLDYSSGKVLLLSSLAMFIPQIALMLLSGVLSDGRKRKSVIILSDAVSSLVAVFLILAISYGRDSIAVFIISLAIRSACSGLQSPAVDSAVALMAEDGRREKANGMRGLLSSAVMLLSPVLAGLLLPAAGVSGLMAIDAVTALLAICALIPLHLPESLSSSSSLSSGIRYAISDSLIRRMLVFHFIALFLISPGAALTPLLVARVHGGGESLLALSEAAYSFGMVAGGLVLSFGVYTGNRKRGIAVSLFVYALMLVVAGLSPFFMLYTLINAIIGFVSPRYTAFMNSEIQDECEVEMMGRVMSFLAVVTSSAIPCGLLVAAPLADILDIRIVFIVFGLLAGLHALFFALRDLR